MASAASQADVAELRRRPEFQRLPWLTGPTNWTFTGSAKNVNDALVNFENGAMLGTDAPNEHFRSLFGLPGAVDHSSSGNTFKSPQKAYESHMSDWWTLLVRAQSLFKEDNSSPNPAPTANRKLQLLRQALNYESQNRARVILRNFTISAFHLCLLLEGKADLPDDYAELCRVLQLDDQEALSFKPKSMACLKSPLQCSLAISPLCLLMTFDLSKRNTSRQDLLSAWMGLTAIRPPRLKEVEDCLWSALFDIATLNVD
ncbi:hypothetical protein BDN72DRAFT_907096, partial [Pluteus cervinus]